MRWIKLVKTSPSGKSMFVCKYCGGTTPAPTKECPSPPEVYGGIPPALPCHELEQKELEELTHPLLNNLLLRTTTLVGKIINCCEQGNKTRAYQLVREHREAVRRLISSAVYKRLSINPSDKWDGWAAIDDMKDDLWNR